MAKLNSRVATLGSVLASAMLVAGVIGLLFTPSTKSLRNDIRRIRGVLEGARTLLARKPAIQSEWEAKRNSVYSGLAPDTVLNAWVKDLLTAAQSKALAVEKLEPAGIKNGEEGKRLTVFISFQGNIRQFTQWVYELMEKDPLSRIESFSVRHEEGSKSLFFELMLGKTVQ